MGNYWGNYTRIIVTGTTYLWIIEKAVYLIVRLSYQIISKGNVGPSYNGIALKFTNGNPFPFGSVTRFIHKFQYLHPDAFLRKCLFLRQLIMNVIYLEQLDSPLLSLLNVTT